MIGATKKKENVFLKKLKISDETGIVDPCEKETVDVTENLTSQQREELTASAHVNSLVFLIAKIIFFFWC